MCKVDLEELYWTDLEEISKDKEKLTWIFNYIKDYNSRDLKELSNILKLYNNPSGLFTKEFANIVFEIYNKDRIRFIKALNLVKEEAINLVYVFRMRNFFIDEDKEFMAMLNSKELSQEEIDTANTFLKMYRTICVL